MQACPLYLFPRPGRKFSLDFPIPATYLIAKTKLLPLNEWLSHTVTVLSTLFTMCWVERLPFFLVRAVSQISAAAPHSCRAQELGLHSCWPPRVLDDDDNDDDNDDDDEDDDEMIKWGLGTIDGHVRAHAVQRGWLRLKSNGQRNGHSHEQHKHTQNYACSHAHMHACTE